MIFTQTKVKQIIGALHPEAMEMPTSFQTIATAERLLSYMDEKGIPVSLRHTSGELWLMGEAKASGYIQNMLDVIYLIDADMRVQDSRL